MVTYTTTPPKSNKSKSGIILCFSSSESRGFAVNPEFLEGEVAHVIIVIMKPRALFLIPRMKTENIMR